MTAVNIFPLIPSQTRASSNMADAEVVLHRIATLEAEIRLLQTQLHQAEQSITIAQSSGCFRVNICDIQYIRAESNYSRIYMTDGRQYFLSRTLKSLEAQLPTEAFVRCHKSFLVARNAILALHGVTAEIGLTTGIRLPVARSRRKEIRQVFKPHMQLSEIHTDAKPVCAYRKLNRNAPPITR